MQRKLLNNRTMMNPQDTYVLRGVTSLVYIYVKLQTYIQQNICKEKK